MLLVSTRSSPTTRILSLSSTLSTTALSLSRCQWICVRYLAYRSGNVLRCSLSMFRCTLTWLDAVITLVTPAPFLAKAHRQLGSCFKDISFPGLTEFDIRPLLPVYWFTRSMPRTVGLPNIAGWAESRPEAQMGWTWVAVRGDPRGVYQIFAIISSAHCRASAHTAQAVWPKCLVAEH